MSWRVVFLCPDTFTTHYLSFSLFLLLSQQVHHGRLHEKLRLIRNDGNGRNDPWSSSSPHFPSFYTGHILFSHRMSHYEAAYNLTWRFWRLCIDGSWA
ncbi:hypothetical protein F5144DRAFT_556864 [Chaetomium tenue]|uniref:Uncharacterized protein n=1 Tax=Chaetomium tenue TaxID=1854479 RepID=A0ACB7PRG4_9PEZI|nr:hypothetical protein F5144DRAFT_556864 [Chaetomium globosum]